MWLLIWRISSNLHSKKPLLIDWTTETSSTDRVTLVSLIFLLPNIHKQSTHDKDEL